MIHALLLAPPLLASAMAILIRRYRPIVGWLGVIAAAVSFAAALALALPTAPHPGPAAGSLWHDDALSALLAVSVALVTLLGSAMGPGLTPGGDEDVAEARRFRIFLNAFAFTMLLAVTLQNVALMWVAIEATTITSAVVIPLHRTKASVEASWKYLLICSVGIALAFTGTVLAYFDFVATAGNVPDALSWPVLRSHAASLHPEILQLAFAFILIGYGTKAGLAPMHTWLPDAHSEAPSPISAMMSGVLLAVAMYAMTRWKAVVDAGVDASFTGTLLVGFGLASVVVGALSLVIQRHYKRMLAYSSVEHMGLVAIGLGLGPLGVFAAWLHVVNHALAKSMSFVLAGRILCRYGTTEIAHVTGLLRVMPWTGALFAAAILALVGLPPFGLFVSEFLLVRAAILGGRPWLAAALLALLLTTFISLVAHLNRMLYGEAPAGVRVGERPGWRVVALAASAASLVVFGVALPPAVSSLLTRCAGLLP